jgi:hypothetical protein
MKAAHEAGLPADPLEDDDDLEADAAPVSASQRAEFLALIEEANREPSEEESARIIAAFEHRSEKQRAHPLSMAAREYMEIAQGVLEVLEPMVKERGDPLAMAALDGIGRFAGLIAVKTHRATGALVRTDDQDEEVVDEEFEQSDGNGCAKLLRFIIAESREAWLLLTLEGSATADGVPAAMARRLQALEHQIAAAFPRAMEFVRPGFDEFPEPD